MPTSSFREASGAAFAAALTDKACLYGVDRFNVVGPEAWARVLATGFVTRGFEYHHFLSYPIDGCSVRCAWSTASTAGCPSATSSAGIARSSVRDLPHEEVSRDRPATPPTTTLPSLFVGPQQALARARGLCGPPEHAGQRLRQELGRQGHRTVRADFPRGQGPQADRASCKSAS